jgi:hypothetical protein
MEHTANPTGLYTRLDDYNAMSATLISRKQQRFNCTPKLSFILGRPSPCQPIHVVSRRNNASVTPGLDTLVHIVPTGTAQLVDYGTDLISLFIFHSEGLRIQLAVGAGSMLLSIVFTWFGMLHRGGQQFGFDVVTGWRRHLIMALVPVNVHTLAMGVVVAQARGALTAQSTDEERASVKKQIRAFAFFKAFETGLESVPFAVPSVSALSVLSTGATSHALGLAASLAVSLLSISYAFHSQVTSAVSQRNDYRPLPRSTSAQLFLCISYHVCWVISATGVLVGASSLGPLRWLGPLLLLVCGGGSFSAAQFHLGVLSPALILVLSVAVSPGLSILDHVVCGPPTSPAFYDSSPVARAMPILRRSVIMTSGVASALSSGFPRLAALSVLLAAVDALVYRRLLLLGGLTQHPDDTETPLVLVPSDSPNRCIFENTAALRAGSALEIPATLSSHPGRGLVVSAVPRLDHECKTTPNGLCGSTALLLARGKRPFRCGWTVATCWSSCRRTMVLARLLCA